MLVNLNEILLDAQKNKYAVGLFNTTDSDSLAAAIEAAEEMHSPIIIGTAEVLLQYGELQLMGPGMVNMAKNNWLELSIDDAINSILDFISSLELVEV